MNMHTKTPGKKIGSAAVIAGLSLLGLAASGVRADTPGAHPHYVHALTDLRAARAFLAAGDEQNVERNAGAAIIEIDQSLSALRRAAIDDGKNLNMHYPVDTSLSHRDRLNRALILLDKARQDIVLRESDPAALSLQRTITIHVDRAYSDTQQAIHADYHDDHPLLPGSHPHFLHAIANLRAARGLLNAPAEGSVAADERAASQSLTEAIRFAKQGAVDDGLDIFYNPAPATNLPRRSRLAQADKLIQDARTEETRYGETDPHADGALYHAFAATDRAFQQVNQAIHDDQSER